MHLFGVVQAHRTSSNLHEPHHHRDSNVCRHGVDRVGLIKFDVLNHPELVHKHPTHLAISVLVCFVRFNEVRCA